MQSAAGASARRLRSRVSRSGVQPRTRIIESSTLPSITCPSRTLPIASTAAKIASGEEGSFCHRARCRESIPADGVVLAITSVGCERPVARCLVRENFMLIHHSLPHRVFGAALVASILTFVCPVAGAQQAQPPAPAPATAPPATAPPAQPAPAIVPFVPASTPEQEKL